MNKLNKLINDLRIGKEVYREDSEYANHVDNLIKRDMLKPMAKSLLNKVSKEEVFLVAMHEKEFMEVFHETGLRATRVLEMVR